ncbi:hypothetical protein MAR_005773 [Mya arenaria]|uniref:Uncharacterized protein n=2 Tax=Mya arenaria TaxID=6604 RepID=A0ABY7F4N6_MYAAR|nr:uncharacterized protein LOC128246439 isoform X1 [Mya arenaria]WAR15668.1 hypothetical protein MAR_005773 [Mya arenaria]
MKIVLLLTFAFLHVCTCREIVKKNAVIFEIEDSDESNIAYDDAESFDDEIDDSFDYDLEALQYPGDCKSSKLINFAEKGGCKVKKGKQKHITITKDNRLVTRIPHHVKSNGTCRSIIDALNANCS